MKITELHLYAHPLPVRDGPYRMASTEVWSLDTTLVKLVTDSGLIGWGETCPVGPVYQPQHAAGARAALAEMAPGLIGADPLQPLRLQRRMDGLLNGHRYAKAAIDIAAHDLMGKAWGVRVADLLGGAVTERVPSYYASGVGEPDEIARIAAERADEGYPRMQVKIGGRPVEIDIETIRKVWERVGTRMRLAVDGNRGLTTRDALRLSRECPEIPFILEQPCNSIEEIAAIRGQLHHAVYLDETAEDVATVLRAVGQGVCDGFGMKVTRIGGLRPMAVFRDICEVRSMPHTCDDAWGGDIIAAACTHIGATVQPRLMEGVWLAQPYIEGHFDPENGLRIEGGHIRLPEGPGLGIVPDESLFGAPVASFG
ncbi:mandelate racemase [Rhodobacter sphaeroides]|uniref:Mandelate racemase/muconate lactonizing enzyme n=1 Tax=Cereibacter sphaeroides (strain ATCC 17023 / DSM 158 / JCM 6121 / CCUG 31486 / LMG 2827 / NBRC 12203 / NCIMB 8253 / ATH 2.4.1.) TaxID=272943 RepID=Q3IVH7_CERS4|nr:enolase C-terminal domain-like protein [Cereibacter sphaeroides]ABA81457.1 Mandelate racemase/muconate lactonizing enzyme [Cereibacter sphaeroides 2.4.1]AMJ50015.1 mandelate racemase [Cereibacter sphaeroides]ANS36805.1 mandelate racemase [Cereibacter sphaeroides]ATN65802.1 mandelate racemase [Cereibacter sphaeroides]AXC63936.1 mandelate racemase [Cereibacter sphaeroides 2.4.1]